MIKYIINLSLLLFAFHLTSGQTINIKEVVIEGKAEQSAVEQQKEAVSSKLVVSSKVLNNLGYSTAGDVIKMLPRIVVQGPPSFNRNIMMAGLDKEFQSVLINGNRPAGGEDYRDFKLDRLPLAMIEMIEVTYNPPAYLGADASIGSVDITLKNSVEEEFLSANVQTNFTSTEGGINPDLSLSYGNKWGKWSAYGNFNLNSFERINENFLSDDSFAGTENENLDVTITGINAFVSYEPNSSSLWKLHSFFTNYEEELNFIADIKRKSNGTLSQQEDIALDEKLRMLHSHELSYTKKGKSSNWKTSLTLAQHFDKKDRNRNREKSTGREVSLEDEDQTNTEVILASRYSLDKTLFGLDHQFKAGLEFSFLDRTFDRISYTKLEGHMFWDDIVDGSYKLKEFRAGGYISDDIKIDKLWINPALRIDIDEGNFEVLNNEGSNSYTSLNPSLHLKYEMGEELFLKGDVARQIARPPFNLKVPVDKVKHKKGNIERGNEELIPSKAWNFSLGIEKYFSEKNYVVLRGFYSQIRDVIETSEIGIDDHYGYRIFQPVNVDSAKVWGVDLSTSIQLLHTNVNTVSFWGNASWLNSEVRDPISNKLRRLNEQPEWIVNGSLDYFNSALRIKCSLAANYIGERVTAGTSNEDVGNDLIQKPFLQMDARIKYYFSDWGGVHLNCVNLLDRKVDITQGVISESEVIGRNIILGVSINL